MQLRIRAIALAGVSANRIAGMVNRGRGTVDRILTDNRGLRLAFWLASRPASYGWCRMFSCPCACPPVSSRDYRSSSRCCAAMTTPGWLGV